MKVLIVGPHPPLIGGISTHNQRYAEWLREQGNEVRVLDLHYRGTDRTSDAIIDLPVSGTRRLWQIINAIRAVESDTLIHFHVATLTKFRWIAPVFLLVFSSHAKIISLHAGEFTWHIPNTFLRLYYKLLLTQFDHIIAVNSDVSDYVISQFNISRNRISVIPAFIRQQPDSSLIPKQIRRLEGKKRLVITSGDLQGNYEHDTLIDCIEQLDAEKYVFIFAFYFDPVSDHGLRIIKRLASLSNVIVLYDTAPEEYVSIVSVCDIYVRTRVTDGDSVAIREAEDLGLTVFAGDNVWRPPSCRLFPLGDSAALLRLFRDLEQRTPSVHLEAIQQNDQNNAARLFEVYKKVVGKKLISTP